MAYKKVQFIAHCIYTAPKSISGDKQKYVGLSKTSDDIKARVELVGKVIDGARTNSKTEQKDSETLKIFMIPEFFFRGETGAYDMDDVQTVVSSLQTLVKGPEWKDWIFVFGSILGKSFQTKLAGFWASLFGHKDVIDIGKSIEGYNFVLVQKGGFGDGEGAGPAAAKAILKEHKSTLDFIKKDKSVGGIIWERVDHLTPFKEYGTASEEQIKSYDGSSIFKIDDITFGLEVCLDHDKKRLKGSKNCPPIDIQLVPSCGSYIKDDAIVAKKGGYIFNCDGYANYDTHSLGYNSQVKKIGTGDIDTFDTPINIGNVQIDSIYAKGAGTLRIYPAQDLPA
ncbi:hypothetical protein Riv7116_3068 [Rivularia sp. PCC 7116]|uniref:hypothetical protein n=1 Tax=Rivularia sp. PCC 7116 TaxID=373994 RepID=UPI00029ED97D|nr:hypothetical protein [Rivularia sp. PCC 7116]AFY55544.1 hypothetical protein Riv7116_3068 [Rivularia sp. PCC 7116]